MNQSRRAANAAKGTPARRPGTSRSRGGRAPSRRAPWLALLAGPLLGTGYFWFVYLLGEAACAEQQTEQYPGWVRAVTLGLAGLGGALGWLAWHRLQRWRDAPTTERSDESENRRFVAFVATLLLALFVLFVAMVAAPALGSQLC